jgi:hypothetical protein
MRLHLSPEDPLLRRAVIRIGVAGLMPGNNKYFERGLLEFF